MAFRPSERAEASASRRATSPRGRPRHRRAAALDEAADDHGGKEEEAGGRRLPCPRNATDGHVVEDHHQDERPDEGLADLDAARRKAAGAECDHGDGEEFEADADRRADDTGACREEDAGDAGKSAAGDVGRSAAGLRRDAGEARGTLVVADGVEPTSVDRAGKKEPGERGRSENDDCIEGNAEDARPGERIEGRAP